MASGRILDLPCARAFVPFLRPARYKGAWGGRGSAKSHEFAKNLLKRCVEKPGTRWMCVREVQLTLKQSVKKLLADKIKAFDLGDQFHESATDIRTPGGGIIVFQGMQDHTADSVKSFEGFDGAWVEEAQTFSERSLTLLRPTIRKEYDDGTTSEIWFTWNPDQPTDPVDKFLRGPNPPSNSVVIGVSYKDNPWFPNVLRVEMEWDKKRDLDKYLNVWEGAYLQHSEARVFKNWAEEEFESKDDWTFYWGADWGFSVDPTTLGRAHLEGRTLYLDYECYKIGVETDYMPAFFDSTICGCDSSIHLSDAERLALCSNPKFHGEARKWTITADSARPETISYMTRHGYPRMRGAKKGAGSVAEGVKFLQSFDIKVHPRCKHTIDELTHYRYKVDKLTGLVLPILEDKKNHVIDRLRYAVEELIAMQGTGNLGYPVEVQEASMWSNFAGGKSTGKPGVSDWSGLGG